MLTVKDVADRWGVVPRTVYNLFHSGALPGLKLGPKTIRFREEDVTAYEESCKWSSSNTEANTPSTGETQRDSHSAALLVRAIPPRPNDASPNTSAPLTFGGVRLDSA